MNTAAVLKLKRPTAKTIGKPIHGQVTFRLDVEHLDQLATAANSDGISHHEKARRIVEASLDGDVRELDQVRLEVAELRSVIERQQMGTAEIMAVLLSLIPDGKGERINLKAAREFVAEAFNKGSV